MGLAQISVPIEQRVTVMKDLRLRPWTRGPGNDGCIVDRIG